MLEVSSVMCLHTFLIISFLRQAKVKSSREETSKQIWNYIKPNHYQQSCTQEFSILNDLFHRDSIFCKIFSGFLELNFFQFENSKR